MWSTSTAPLPMPSKAPLVPSVTSRRSSSLPTQTMTKSWPSAAAFGVGAALPPYCSTHFSALAAVRLNTVTSWPPLVLRCPAMGKPITPRPRNATFAIALLPDMPAGPLPASWCLPAPREVIAGASTGVNRPALTVAPPAYVAAQLGHSRQWSMRWR